MSTDGKQSMTKRSYVQDIRDLEKLVDIERAYLNFSDTFEVLRDFFSIIILNTSNLNSWGIGDEARHRASIYLKASVDYSNQALSEADLSSLKIDAWSDYEHFQGGDKKLIRLILCCLTGEKSYLHSVDTDMQDNYFSLILALAFELDEKLGGTFKTFVVQHPAMQKYRCVS